MAGQSQSQETGHSAWSRMWAAGAQVLRSFSLAFLGIFLGVELEVEQPEFEPVPKWDSVTTVGGLAYCDTAVAPFSQFY